MAHGQRKYEKEYKVQAVKLAKEIGAGKPIIFWSIMCKHPPVPWCLYYKCNMTN